MEGKIDSSVFCSLANSSQRSTIDVTPFCRKGLSLQRMDVRRGAGEGEVSGWKEGGRT
jgi:hypothetical protein